MFLYNAKSRYNYYAVRRCVNRGLRRLPPLFGGLKHPFTGPSRRRESRIFKGGGAKLKSAPPPLGAPPDPTQKQQNSPDVGHFIFQFRL